MRPFALLIVTTALLSACATAPRGGSSYCVVGDVEWQSATSGFDRRLTLEKIAGLREAIEADTRAMHEGRRDNVGDRLTAIAHAPVTSSFVSDGVHELAIRLRQLDCAVRGNKLPFEVAIQRYNRILGELSVEQATLEPKGGLSIRAKAAP
jgi:hypothetical protein